MEKSIWHTASGSTCEVSHGLDKYLGFLRCSNMSILIYVNLPWSRWHQWLAVLQTLDISPRAQTTDVRGICGQQNGPLVFSSTCSVTTFPPPKKKACPRGNALSWPLHKDIPFILISGRDCHNDVIRNEGRKH